MIVTGPLPDGWLVGNRERVKERFGGRNRRQPVWAVLESLGNELKGKDD